MKKECETRSKLLCTALDLLWAHSYGSVSVDDICAKAGVNKGSFYHFFPSKTELVVEALRSRCEGFRAAMDHVFSPVTPPLERIAGFCNRLIEEQSRKQENDGKVYGCPYASLAYEMSTTDEKVRDTVQYIFDTQARYLESALRDADAAGDIDCPDPKGSARRVLAHIHGVMLQAKVANDTAPLRDLQPAIWSLLGIRKLAAR